MSRRKPHLHTFLFQASWDKIRCSCFCKHAYSSREEAQDRINDYLSLSKKEHFKRLEVYECRFCGSFHIGHKRKKKYDKT